MLKWLLKNYRRAMIGSFVLLAFFSAILLYSYISTGEFVQKGIDFTGGSQASIDLISTPDSIDIKSVESAVINMFGSESRVKLETGTTNLLLIDSHKEINENDVANVLNSTGIKYESISIQSIGAVIGSAFWQQAIYAIIVAFIFMGIVVFFTFKKVIPSIAVVLAAFSDIIVALGLMNIFGMKLSLASLAALLMLIGYSVDTDILLSTRVLKRHGDLDEKIVSSMKTGIMMTATALISAVVLLLVSTSPVFDQIATVVIFGLSADIVFTWVQNVGIIKWYVLSKEKKVKE